MNIEEYLSNFEKFTKDPTLEAMNYLMSKFGNPHKELKCVHIAGTNGKGSVTEMLNNCLIKAGYKVGKFVSPHLITFNDGICINNEPIADEKVEKILNKLSTFIEEYNEKHEIKVKWFEVITTLALIYFCEEKCDLAVIETGLGGSVDCTNIIEPLVSIITTIGYDHVDILGNDIIKIAEQKAGIIKKNSKTVFINQDEITKVIKEKCKQENNELHLLEKNEIKNYTYSDNLQKFDYKNFKNIEINLRGKIQTCNAIEVLETIDILRNYGYNIPKEAITEGLKTVIHKARMEKIWDKPITIFDGGHNENAIENLKLNINQYYKDKKRIYIVSILETKDYASIIKKISEDKDGIFYFTNGIKERPYVLAENLAKEAKKYIKEEQIKTKELRDALVEAKEKYIDEVIFVIGSFYVYKTVIKTIEEWSK